MADVSWSPVTLRDEHFDVLVLGGGSAGCVLAARLSEQSDRSVCLVEAGPDYGPHAGGAWPADMLDAREVPTSHDWCDDEHTLPVARVIGGCSSHNLVFLVWGAAADYDEWAHVTQDSNWGATSMVRYRRRVEDALPVRRFADAELSPWLRVIHESAEALGISVHDDVNSPEMVEGLARAPVNVIGTTRWNAAFAYLNPARSRPNLTILADALVDRIEVDGDRATGAVVRRDGEELRLPASLVVLSAGTYGSAAVLLRSGIGPELELRRHQIPVRAVLPVGERLIEHFGVRVVYAPTDGLADALDRHAALDLGFLAQGVIKACSSCADDALWDLHLVVIVLDAPRGRLAILNTQLMKPQWTGTVRLRSADPSRLPLVAPPMLDHERDAMALLDGVRLARALASAAPARAAVKRELAPGPEVEQLDRLRDHCAANLQTYWHPVGTCSMGPSADGRSVADSNGLVHGFQNLHVADASILPTIPRANTNLTVLAVAERIAELLV